MSLLAWLGHKPVNSALFADVSQKKKTLGLYEFRIVVCSSISLCDTSHPKMAAFNCFQFSNILKPVTFLFYLLDFEVCDRLHDLTRECISELHDVKVAFPI